MRMRVIHVSRSWLHRSECENFGRPWTFRGGRGAQHHVLRKRRAVYRDILLQIIVPRDTEDVVAGKDGYRVPNLSRPNAVPFVISPYAPIEHICRIHSA